MSNRVYMRVHKTETVDIDGSSVYPERGPWYELCVFDDTTEFYYYLGHVRDTDLNEHSEIFSPGGAIAFINEHEGEHDYLADWALEHGLSIMDDWYSPEELQKAYAIYQEENDG